MKIIFNLYHQLTMNLIDQPQEICHIILENMDLPDQYNLASASYPYARALVTRIKHGKIPLNDVTKHIKDLPTWIVPYFMRRFRKYERYEIYHEACVENVPELVDTILNKLNFDLTKYDDGMTVYELIEQENTEVFKIVINHYNTDTEKLRAMFSNATCSGASEIVSILLANPALELRADDDPRNFRQQSDAFDAFAYMANYGHISLCEVLLADRRLNPGVHDNFAIIRAAENGYYHIVRLLLKDPRVDPAANNNEAIRLAASYGRTQTVIMLLKDPRVSPVDALYCCMTKQLDLKKSHMDIIQILLKHPKNDPSVNNSLAVAGAVSQGLTDVVLQLLADNRVDPSANNSSVVTIAVEMGNSRALGLILTDPRVDPSANNNAALKSAMLWQEYDCMRMLLSDRRIRLGTLTEREFSEVVDHLIIYKLQLKAFQQYAR